MESSVKSILAIYAARGHEEYHGEPVSQLEHALQTAELAQLRFPHDHEFIIAAFLHDFGHLCGNPDTMVDMEGYGTWQHELIGAKVLAQMGFSDKISRLVAGHVQAKRYLVSTDTAYFEALSDASKITLQKQGGILEPEAHLAFEQDDLFDLHIALRRLDEQAKIPNRPANDLFWLENMMREHLASQA